MEPIAKWLNQHGVSAFVLIYRAPAPAQAPAAVSQNLQNLINGAEDLRTQRPEVYATLKAELIDHITNINADYPGDGISKGLQKEKVKPQGNLNPAPKHRSQEQFFKNRDRNGDGNVTLEEYIGNPKGRNVPALTKRFKKIDSNGDGKLRLDELKK
jgi:hypothetical protein